MTETMSAPFDVLDFVHSPHANKLSGATISKDDWKFIATSFKIQYSSSDTKKQIANRVIKELISREKLDPSVSVSGTAPWISQKTVESDSSDNGSELGSDTSETRERRQSVDVGKLNMERVAARERAEASERLLELERIKMREQMELELRKIEATRQAKEVELQIELRKTEAEERKLALELQLAKFKVDNPGTLPENKPMGSAVEQQFDVSKYASLVAMFDEKDPEGFFEQFEKIAVNLGWNKKYWAVLVQTKFIGQARQVYTSLNASDSMDYDMVKTTVLTAYDQVAENYRQQFRSHKKSSDRTYIEFAEDLSRQLQKWLKACHVEDFASLKELILLEQFKRVIPPEVRVYLDERETPNARSAARLADKYVLTHRLSDVSGRAGYFVKDCSSNDTYRDSGYGQSVRDSNVRSPEMYNYGKNYNYDKGKQGRNSDLWCTFCKKRGHLITDCYQPDCRNSRWYGWKPKPTPSRSVQPSLNVQVESVKEGVSDFDVQTLTET